jgi:hypothetical protein
LARPLPKRAEAVYLFSLRAYGGLVSPTGPIAQRWRASSASYFRFLEQQPRVKDLYHPLCECGWRQRGPAYAYM